MNRINSVSIFYKTGGFPSCANLQSRPARPDYKYFVQAKKSVLSNELHQTPIGKSQILQVTNTVLNQTFIESLTDVQIIEN